MMFVCMSYILTAFVLVGWKSRLDRAARTTSAA